MSDRKMGLVLFSGTNDKLHAAATLTSGAAAMGVETHLFLTFWGVSALKRGVEERDLPMSADYGTEAAMVAKLMQEKGAPSWKDVLGMAIDIGDVKIHACAHTMDLMDLDLDDLDPMVDDVIGVATFISLTEGAQTLFI